MQSAKEKQKRTVKKVVHNFVNLHSEARTKKHQTPQPASLRGAKAEQPV